MRCKHFRQISSFPSSVGDQALIGLLNVNCL